MTGLTTAENLSQTARNNPYATLLLPGSTKRPVSHERYRSQCPNCIASSTTESRSIAVEPPVVQPIDHAYAKRSNSIMAISVRSIWWQCWPNRRAPR